MFPKDIIQSFLDRKSISVELSDGIDLGQIIDLGIGVAVIESTLIEAISANLADLRRIDLCQSVQVYGPAAVRVLVLKQIFGNVYDLGGVVSGVIAISAVALLPVADPVPEEGQVDGRIRFLHGLLHVCLSRR